MKAVTATVYMRYAMNFVRSATAPEMMVAAVAANTVWKIKNAKSNIPSSVDGSISDRKKLFVPIQPLLFAPNINPKPTIQKTSDPMEMSITFFMMMFAAFLALVAPASSMAKPACMRKTSAVANSTHTMSR